MAKQASRKPAARKTASRRKKKNDNKSVYLGAALVIFLALLITVGAISFSSSKNDKSAAKKEEKRTVSIPVPEKKTSSAGVTPVAKKEAAHEEPEIHKDASDISSLVRLVLFDYEIARSAVEERISKTPKGKTTYHFTVKAHPDTVTKLRGALLSVLKQNGYRTGTSKRGAIGADGSKDAVNIVFNGTMSDTAAKDGNKTKNGQTASNKENARTAPARPEPPAAADVVVKLAILLDDGGNNIELAKRFVKLPFPVGIAILPHLKYSEATARLASSYGKTVFLHFPMEPKSYPSTDPGEGAALVSMPELLIDAVAKKNFESLGVPIDGFNNHMGSAITEDKVKMAQIMAVAGKYTGVFVDSRTTANSVAYDECVKAGMKCGINKRFIDNDNDVNAIIAKIYESAELAKKNGEALVIGHIRQHTLDALEIALPILQERKITIVPVTSVVR